MTRLLSVTEQTETSRSQADWRLHPATKPQIDCLRSRGLITEPGLTKGRASQLIDGEATEGQIRRLGFYKIEIPQYLTKMEVSRLIDAYIAANPESEALYNAWKSKGKKTHPIPQNRPAQTDSYTQSLYLAARASTYQPPKATVKTLIIAAAIITGLAFWLYFAESIMGLFTRNF